MVPPSLPPPIGYYRSVERSREFDTARMEDGPVSRVHLDAAIPMTFHGLWMDPKSPG